jgi:hypothetical protein
MRRQRALLLVAVTGVLLLLLALNFALFQQDYEPIFSRFGGGN